MSFFDSVTDAIDEISDEVAQVAVPMVETVANFMQGGPKVNYDEIKLKAKEYYGTLPLDKIADGDLLVPDLIKKYGYPCETHLVITDDGYILALHRIPHGKKPGPYVPKRPILVVHGLMSSSADWILPGPEAAIAYILADNGYDVWLANCRGNRYSCNHTHLRTENSMFWDFSFQEIAEHDLPAFIDYILEETKQPSLYYMGHSQGTTVSYALCAAKPEYNKKINVAISFAPIGFMDHLKSPILRMVMHMTPELEMLGVMFGEQEFAPHMGILRQVSPLIGPTGGPVDILLTNSLFALVGYTPLEIDPKILPVLMGHDPAGGSTKQIIHYGQEMRSRKFRKYDNEAVDNAAIYNSAEPPSYNLENITCPHIIYYSHNDWISSPIDVDRLMEGLKNCPKKEKVLVNEGKFNHLDYLYALCAPKILYPQVLDKLKGF